MILFITAQDAATNDNLVVAGHLTGRATNSLCGPDAVRAELLPLLDHDGEMPLLALSHGGPKELRGHDDAVGIDEADSPRLSDRCTYALACHTGEVLGAAVAAEGGVWFGYAGPVNALPADDDTLILFRQIVDFIADEFPSCITPALADQFLRELSRLTDEGGDAISETATMEQMHALRDISRRLRIWLPHSEEPIKHAEAYGDPVL